MTARKTRVLQVVGALYFGGAEKVVANLARDVDRTRFEMAVCCTRAEGPLAEPIRASGVPVTLVTPVDAGRAGRYMTPLHMWRAIREFAPDVVHTHALPALVQIGPLALLKRTPRWVHTYHYGNYPYASRRYMRVERLFSAHADQLVAVSEPQREIVMRHHRIDAARILTIPNGVDDPAVSAGGARARKRQELGLDAGAFVVGAVAVLTEQKGMTYLMQAARTIVDRMPLARIVVAGGGPLEEPLKREAEALGIGRHVLFTGWRADVSELMLAFDVFVMPSLWEAMPLALLEALAAGRPIVLTTVGDNRRIVEDGAAGVLVPPRDPASIAAAVLQLVDRPDEARKLGARARRRFEERFRTDRMVRSYEALYAGRPVDAAAAESS